jgi:hypothetical protein
VSVETVHRDWKLAKVWLMREIFQFRRSPRIQTTRLPTRDSQIHISTSVTPGDICPREAIPLTKAAALKAIQLDDNSAEAHTSLAIVKAMGEWEFPGAEQELKRAIALNPNYATAQSLPLSRRNASRGGRAAHAWRRSYFCAGANCLLCCAAECWLVQTWRIVYRSSVRGSEHRKMTAS